MTQGTWVALRTAMNFNGKVFDASRAGVGDLAIGLWIAEGSRRVGEEVRFTPSGYDQVVRAFGFCTSNSIGHETLEVGGASRAYAEELESSNEDVSPRTMRWQRTVGWNFVPSRPFLQISNSVPYEWAEEVVARQRTIVIAPQAAHASRSLPRQKRIRLAWALHEKGVRTVAIDRNKEVVEPFPLYAFGYDWEHVLALLDKSCIVLGNDSGVTHLAATVGKPTLAALGPTHPNIVFGHCLDVVKIISSPSVACLSCHFSYDRGYRVACDHGCEALSMIPFSSLEVEILEMMGIPPGA